MAAYFMFGKYSVDSIKGISAKRTEKAEGVISKFGGKLHSAYALLGEHDLVLITEFPSSQEVIKASVALTKLTGVAFSTSEAITVENFDNLIADI